jgi:hypothetical protein
MAELVSPCCGGDYSDHIDDEGYDFYKCDEKNCNEIFREPIEDYEYRQQRIDERNGIENIDSVLVSTLKKLQTNRTK